MGNRASSDNDGNNVEGGPRSIKHKEDQLPVGEEEGVLGTLTHFATTDKIDIEEKKPETLDSQEPAQVKEKNMTTDNGKVKIEDDSNFKDVNWKDETKIEGYNNARFKKETSADNENEEDYQEEKLEDKGEKVEEDKEENSEEEYSSNSMNVHGTTTSSTTRTTARAQNRKVCNPPTNLGAIQESPAPTVQHVVHVALPRGVEDKRPIRRASDDVIAGVDLRCDVVYSQQSMLLKSIKGVHIISGYWGIRQLRKLCKEKRIPLPKKVKKKRDICQFIVKRVIALGVPSTDMKRDHLREKLASYVSDETPTMTMHLHPDTKKVQQEEAHDEEQFQDPEEEEEEEEDKAKVCNQVDFSEDYDNRLYEQKRKTRDASEDTNKASSTVRSKRVRRACPTSFFRPEDFHKSDQAPCSKKRPVSAGTASTRISASNTIITATSHATCTNNDNDTATGTTASHPSHSLPFDESSIQGTPKSRNRKIDLKRDVVYDQNLRQSLGCVSGTTRLVSIKSVLAFFWTKSELAKLCVQNSVPGLDKVHGIAERFLSKADVCELIVERAIALGVPSTDTTSGTTNTAPTTTTTTSIGVSELTAAATHPAFQGCTLPPAPAFNIRQQQKGHTAAMGPTTTPVFARMDDNIPFSSAPMPARPSQKMVTNFEAEKIIATSNIRQDVVYDRNFRVSVGGSPLNGLMQYEDGKTRLMSIRHIHSSFWGIDQLKQFCVRHSIVGAEAFDKAGVCELIVERAILLGVPSTDTKSTTRQLYPNEASIARAPTTSAPNSKPVWIPSNTIDRMSAATAPVKTTNRVSNGGSTVSVPEPRLPATEVAKKIIATVDVRRDVVYDQDIVRRPALAENGLQQYRDGKTRLVSIRGISVACWSIDDLKNLCDQQSIAGYPFFDKAGICELIVERAIFLGVPSTNTTGKTRQPHANGASPPGAPVATMIDNYPVPFTANDCVTGGVNSSESPGIHPGFVPKSAATPIAVGEGTFLRRDAQEVGTTTPPIPTLIRNPTQLEPPATVVTENFIATSDLQRDIVYDQDICPRSEVVQNDLRYRDGKTRLISIRGISIGFWDMHQLKHFCVRHSIAGYAFFDKAGICELIVERAIFLGVPSTDTTRKTRQLQANGSSIRSPLLR